MAFSLPLKIYIPLIVFVLGGSLSAFESYLNFSGEQARIIKEASDSVRITGRSIANEIEREALHLPKNHIELNRELSYFAIDNLSKADLFNQDLNILFSVKMTQGNFTTNKDISKTALSTFASQVIVDLNKKELSIYIPLRLPESQGSLKFTPGVLYLNFDLTKKLIYASNLAWDKFYISLIEFLLLSSILVLVLHFLIFKRINNLNSASSRIRNEQYNVYLDDKGSDEISHINHAFNNMLNSIKETQYKLNEQIKLEQKTNRLLKEHSDQAEEANRAKSQFLSSMSHELRTPLNAIIGFTQLLEFSELDELQKDQLNSISTAGDHLLNLINQVLELAKIESSDLNLKIEAVSVEKVIAESLDLTKTLLEKHNVKLIQNSGEITDHAIKADFVRLKQILINLLSNAIKYNKPEGSVEIQTELMEFNQKPYLKISVIDSGIGIPEHIKDKVFEPFNRIGQEGTNIEGTGIGLSITKLLTEEMNGELGFESSTETGSKFWVSLPIYNDEEMIK